MNINGWMRHAACQGMDTALFYPDDLASEEVSARFCRTNCSVVSECLSNALAFERKEGLCNGVAGGLTATERLAHLSNRRSLDEQAIDKYLNDFPKLSSRQLAKVIKGEVGTDVSYQTLVRRRRMRWKAA